jgi:predicted ATP-dependent endonuclease of OLD family
MYLSKIRVKNYKSFRDSGDLEFKPGINLIVGQNNSGKTALLESLSLRFYSVEHKSIKNILKRKLLQIPQRDEENSSIVEGTIIIPEHYLLDLGNEILWMPYIVGEPRSENSQKIENFGIENYEIYIKEYISLHFSHNGSNARKLELKGSKESEKNYKLTEQEDRLIGIMISEEKKLNFVENTNPPQKHSTSAFTFRCSNTFFSRIYKFQAERSCKNGCIVGLNRELKTNGENLAEVLLNAQTNNDEIYKELIEYASEVIPSVKWVSSVRTERDQGPFHEIKVWTIDKKSKREDLAIPLSECGTGIGQVLAILYVVVTSEEPRTIIIDEPNSFLHPGAAKKLIQILNKFPQHQYFISTHSPEVLSAAKPSTITRLKYVDGETIAKSVNLEQTKDLRETLDEIGVRFSDVFFTENILWVEGETEEKAFPLILESADKLFDVAILPLVHTDDLRERKAKGRKHAKLVFEIYERLSGANALTPPFVAVILDKESSSQEEINKLIEIFGDKLKFIPRMMYENYLIDAEALTNTLNAEIIENTNKVNIEQVEKWIEEKRENKYLSKKEISDEILETADWIKKIHAANLLETLFSELSNKTVEYRKTTHSVKLTQWLLENKPEQLSELKEFLINLISDK